MLIYWMGAALLRLEALSADLLKLLDVSSLPAASLCANVYVQR